MRFVSAKMLGLTASLALVSSFATVANAQTALTNSGNVVAADLGAAYTAPGVRQAVITNQTFDSGVQSGQRATGTYSAAVYLNGGFLDFYYQFSTVTGSTAPITSFATSVFTGFTTGVGFTTSDIDGALTPFGSSAVASGGLNATGNDASRSGNGGTVTFDFSGNASNGVVVGSNSVTLLVRTNATQFTTSNLTFQGAASANAPGFAPVSNIAAAPEPGSLLLVIPGALGVVGMIRRRKSA